MNTPTKRDAANEYARRLLAGETTPINASPHDFTPPEDVVVRMLSATVANDTREGALDACRDVLRTAIGVCSRIAQSEPPGEKDQQLIERLCRVIELSRASELRADTAAMMTYVLQGPNHFGRLAWDIASAYASYPQTQNDLYLWGRLATIPRYWKFARRQMESIRESEPGGERSIAPDRPVKVKGEAVGFEWLRDLIAWQWITCRASSRRRNSSTGGTLSGSDFQLSSNQISSLGGYDSLGGTYGAYIAWASQAHDIGFQRYFAKKSILNPSGNPAWPKLENEYLDAA
ncbi:MAG: hypothetical protein AMXMBFR47_02620 [Planctomycetota bacterium]